MFDELLNDLRFGLRTLFKNRGFALLAILTLGLGIGANTAIFSVIHGVLLKPLPYADSDRLVLIRQSAPLVGRADAGVSIKEYFTYRDQAADFDGLVEFHQMNFDLLEARRARSRQHRRRLAELLQRARHRSRSSAAPSWPTTTSPARRRCLIVSYSYWQRKFGGDRNIVGQVFEMNDRPHTVVGVLPNVPHYPQENDVYMPTSACPFRAAAEQRINQNARVFSILNVFGKLKPGVTRERAAANVDVLCRRFTADDKTAYRPGSGFTATTVGVREELTRNARPMLLILLGTTGLILLIACANVANLTLARLLRRDRELAVRSALGAGRGRLVRQLLTESTLLAFAGGLFGLLFATWTVGLLTTFVARFTSRTGEVGIDWRVLLFTVAVSMITGLLVRHGCRRWRRASILSGAMKQGSKGAGESAGRRRLQSALIVAQVAVSVVLLVGAGLLLASFYKLQSVDPGYKGDRVMSAELFTNFSKYPNVDTQLRFYLPLVERLESQPGVVSVAVTNAVPLRVVAARVGRLPDRGTHRRRPEPPADGRHAHRQRQLLQDARRPARSGTDVHRGGRSRNAAGGRHQPGDDALLGQVRSGRLAHLARQRADVVDHCRHRRRREAVRPRSAGGGAGLHAAAADAAGSWRPGAGADDRRCGVGGGADSRRGVGDRSEHAGAERPHARRDSRDLSRHAEADRGAADRCSRRWRCW